MAIDLKDAAGPLAPSLDACDREPIHIPGSIQPHGLLLVAQPASLVVIGGAGDIDSRLGPAWIGRGLGELLGQDVLARLDALPDTAVIPLGPVAGVSERFDAVAHRADGRIVVELEPAPAQTASAVTVLAGLESANRSFERAGNLQELCERAAAAFRLLTGFDRVMVYRFLDDDAGVVLAEDRDPALNSFLNHHFPASDIPRQARALYVRNRVRVIPNVGYTPAPLTSASGDLAALDMSDIALRSVSPVHIQYLKNMGVAASASVSIVRDGVLWGLIACHSQAPRYLPYDVRLACDALAGSLSRQIRALDELEHYRERIRLRALEDVVAARLGTEASLERFFASTGDELREVLAADGFAAVQGDTVYAAGRCPELADIRAIAKWSESRAVAQPFSTHQLAEHLPAAQAYPERASGLLATTMSTEQPTVLLWFRAEQVEVVNWAGNPHKTATADPNAPLTPRASFDAWSQAVRGRSQPWTLLEIESASRLMRTIFDARQNRRVRDLNRDLTATIADNERLLLQKDFLLKEVSHRTQNSLQLVSSFLSLQAREIGDPVLSAHLGEAQRRLLAVALVHRRLYSDARLETVDLSRYLDDLCTDIGSTMGDSWKGLVDLSLAPIIVSAAKAVKVGLILTELVINANKYAYAGGAGPISIVLEQHRNRLRLIVADKGSGKAGARQGFGSRMVDAMVKGLDGSLEEAPNDPGLRTIVTAPID
jgi:two-component system, chemotaxis family, sensor kinase Cph1